MRRAGGPVRAAGGRPLPRGRADALQVRRVQRAGLSGDLEGFSSWVVKPEDGGCRLIYNQEVEASVDTEVAVRAQKLIFLTGAPGVLRDRDDPSTLVTFADPDDVSEVVGDDAQVIAVVIDVRGQEGSVTPAEHDLLAAVGGLPIHFHVQLVRLAEEPDGRLIITMAPQEGKSLRVGRDFPLWWLQRRPTARIVAASYGQGLANRNGRSIRRLINDHPDLGLAIAPDNGAAHDWTIAGHQGGVYSVGVGGGLTGRPADLMVIDDPIKDQKEADSATFRENVWEWWTGVAAARLAPGAPVVVILTRWHEDDLAGRLLAQPDSEWRVLNIPAQADHDPERGEVDVLGREPGEFMESTRRRTTEQWERRKREAGSRKWESQYQGRPSPPAGTIFKREMWREYDIPQWVERADGSKVITGFDELILSWDMTFKGTEGTDRVVGQVWARRGADAFLLDQVCDRMDFIRTLREFKQLAARWPQALLKLVEDKANGSAVMSMLGRSVPGMVPVEPDGGKEARAAAVSPLVEAGNVWLPSPDLAPWVAGFIEEAAGFPTASHDDQVDAMTQALNRLILQPLLAGETFTSEDLDDELSDFQIAPY